MNQEQVIAAYRRAAQELAREQRPNTVGVVLTGLVAAAVASRRLGVTGADTDLDAVIEAACGDVLVGRALEEVGVFTALSVISWAGKVTEWIADRAEELLSLQAMAAPMAPSPRELHIATAAMKSAASADDATTAAVAYAGAVAVSRVRIGDAWEASTAEERDAVLAEVILGDPVRVAAEAELNEVRRRGTAGWVHERWDDIEEHAGVLMQLSTAA